MKKFIVKSSRIYSGILYLILTPKICKDVFTYKSGQYISLGFSGINGRPSPMRSFSIASSPGDNFLEFGIRIQGKFTQTLSELPLKSEVFVLGPFGDFTIGPLNNKSVVFLAGGIGITPFISMIRDATRKQSSMPITLLYGCRSQDDIPYLSELTQLQMQNRRLRIEFFISGGPIDKLTGQNVYQGNIDSKLLKRITGEKFENFSYYLCGPRSFMTDLTNTLISSGVNDKQIFSESFSQVSKVNIFRKYTASMLIYRIATISLVVIFLAISGFDIRQSWAKLAAAQAAEQISQTAPFVPDLINRSSLTNQDTSTPTPTSRKTITQNNVRFTTATPSPTATPAPSQNMMNAPSVYQPPRTMMS